MAAPCGWWCPISISGRVRNGCARSGSPIRNTGAPGKPAVITAGAIHGDFERGFIRAECYAIEDLERFKTEKAIREAGKLRSEGKEYVVRDGDVVHFLFNV